MQLCSVAANLNSVSLLQLILMFSPEENEYMVCA